MILDPAETELELKGLELGIRTSWLKRSTDIKSGCGVSFSRDSGKKGPFSLGNSMNYNPAPNMEMLLRSLLPFYFYPR